MPDTQGEEDTVVHDGRIYATKAEVLQKGSSARVSATAKAKLRELECVLAL